jgi:hypothetical protein
MNAKDLLRARSERLRRSRLADVLRAIEAHKPLGPALNDAFQAESNAALLAEFKRRHPKRKTPESWPFGLDVEVAQEIGAPIRAVYEPRADAYKAKLKALEDLREGLAEQLVPLAGPARLLFDTVHESSYSTQGWGAGTYARNAAELRGDVARFHGLTVEVVPVSKVIEVGTPVPSTSKTVTNFGTRTYTIRHVEVYVHVRDELDLTILKYAPGLSLRESVRLCWKRGANPRVFNPYLPHGYEESVGIDYQGRDLRKMGS